MEPKAKRAILITLYDMSKSDLYPDGQMYEVRFQRFKRSGEVENYFVSTETYHEALDYAEQWLQQGVLSDYSKV